MLEEEVATSQFMILNVVYDVAAENGFTGTSVSSKPKDRQATRLRRPPGVIDFFGCQPFTGSGNTNVFQRR